MFKEKKTPMEHKFMFVYQRYLIVTGGDNERDIQRSKKYCDGSMQNYLETKWKNEDSTTKQYIISNSL